ncbi:MAG: type II toxin-antitoxin system RelE/ParE family toxin [Armatimonadaceae bacterium]
MKLEISDKALTDLREIWDYIAERDESAADRVIDDILVALQKLLLMPDLGRMRDDLLPEMRSLVARRPYLAFYRVQEDRVQIIRVLHGMRDLEHVFEEETDE